VKSRKQPRDLLELFEVAWTDPTHLMSWRVASSDRLLAWSDLGSALDARSEKSSPQSFIRVDLAKAASVFEQLDFPRAFIAEVLKALIDDGLDDLAVEVEAKLPPGCAGPWFCDWSRLGARALVGGAFKFLTALLRPRGTRDVHVRYIATETRALLRELGRDATAAAFKREFSPTLADDGSEDWLEEDASEEAFEEDGSEEAFEYDGSEAAFEHDGSEEAFEDDGSEEAMKGRLLAVKLRECILFAE
jgi:hypothetical protein